MGADCLSRNPLEEEKDKATVCKSSSVRSILLLRVCDERPCFRLGGGQCHGVVGSPWIY